MEKAYLGIDESNHGKFPEIFVAVCSNYKKDIKRKNEEDMLPKHRKDLNLENILKKRFFRHLLMPKNLGHKYDDREIKIIAFSTLINYFNDLELVIIDGKGKDSTIREIENLLIFDNKPTIIFEPKGDRYYPIVNVADYVAHKLFKHYTKKVLSKKEYSKYDDTMLPLNMDFYFKYFTSLKS